MITQLNSPSICGLSNLSHLIIKGDVTNKESVDAVFDSDPNITGVIVALGGKTKDVGPTMLSDGTRNIISAMKSRSSAKRIAVVTSIGGKVLPDSISSIFSTVQRIETSRNIRPLSPIHLTIHKSQLFEELMNTFYCF